MVAWALVKEIRTRAGLSQRALASRAGKAQSEIARIERGRQDPSLTTLEKLARAAGLDLLIQLVPHDDHDARLIQSMRALTPEQRIDALEEESAFFASARSRRAER